MRTLYEIIEQTEDGGKPTYEELRFALLAYHSLLFFADGDVKKLQEDDVSQFTKDWVRNENHNRYRKALNQDPFVYIGNNNPDLPAVKKQREICSKIYDKFMKEKGFEEPKDSPKSPEYIVGVDCKENERREK